MIGPEYTSRSVQAVLGPYRSQLIPSVLWIGWLHEGSLVDMAGTSVTHDVFGPSDAGVANTDTVDGGVAGAGWTIDAVGLFDAADGDLVVSAQIGELTPSEGDALFFAPGDLTFEVT